MKAKKYVWECGHVWIQTFTPHYIEMIKSGQWITPDKRDCPYNCGKKIKKVVDYL